MEYTDPERFKIAQKDWASLSEKQRACQHVWKPLGWDVVRKFYRYECYDCGVWINVRRGQLLPPRSEEPTFRDLNEAT